MDTVHSLLCSGRQGRGSRLLGIHGQCQLMWQAAQLLGMLPAPCALPLGFLGGGIGCCAGLKGGWGGGEEGMGGQKAENLWRSVEQAELFSVYC